METGKVTNGLFRGPLLVTVSTLPLQSSLVTPEGSRRFTSLFVSKRAARGEDQTAQRGIAELNQMGKVEPTTICYTVLSLRCLRVVNQMSYLTVGSLENTSRLVDVSLNWTINSTG